MPRQNRVTPAGDIIASPERGMLMGNRGVLHDAEGRIVRPWRERRWIICLLQFKGRRRQVMAPNRYTELFFLDEAAALAAGHRPCAECRRDAFNRFRRAWVAGGAGTAPVTATDIDSKLHEERLAPDGTKRIWRTRLDDLPDGVFVRPADREGCWLVRGGLLLAWSAGGYGERLHRPAGMEAEVLTPASTVAAIRAGYAPGVHESAG